MSWFASDLDSIEVPDYAEAIVGYRMWHIDGGDLCSPTVGTVWPVGEALTAECVSGCASCPSRSNDGHPGHGCGLYAWSSFDAFLELGYRAAGMSGTLKRNVAIGTCLLWGTVQEAEYGYRSEFAMPKSLYSTHSKVDRVAAAYGLELVPVPPSFTRKGRHN